MEEKNELNANEDVEENAKQILETDDEKKTRLLSLRIIYFTMFLMTLGFSIILTGIWPYLDKVSQGSQRVLSSTLKLSTFQSNFQLKIT